MASLFEKAIISREVGDLTDYEPPGTIFVIFENICDTTKILILAFKPINVNSSRCFSEQNGKFITVKGTQHKSIINSDINMINNVLKYMSIINFHKYIKIKVSYFNY